MKYVHGTYYAVGKTALGAQKYMCVVAKSIAPSAAERNRAKRRCRAVFRESADETGRDSLLIRIKPAALKASYADLKRDVATLVQRVLAEAS